MTNEQFWQAVLGNLELSLSKPNFTTWFKNTSVLNSSVKGVTIGRYKPKFLKEIKVVYENFDGIYTVNNALLIDDTPYKVEKNPKNTAIHPLEWDISVLNDEDLSKDNVHGLYCWLEKFSKSSLSVPEFVSSNPYPVVSVNNIDKNASDTEDASSAHDAESDQLADALGKLKVQEH